MRSISDDVSTVLPAASRPSIRCSALPLTALRPPFRAPPLPNSVSSTLRFLAGCLYADIVERCDPRDDARDIVLCCGSVPSAPAAG